MRRHKRLIGILGGMGPAATIDFMQKIVAATPADVDQDHVPLIVHDVPQIPDRTTAIQAGSDAPFLPMLSGMRLLDAAGVECIAIPCNTAHFWHERLARGCRAEVLHIADAVREHLADLADPPASIALMATRGTVAADIYAARGEAGGVRIVAPDEAVQRHVDRAILLTKRNDFAAAREAAEAALDGLVAVGAEGALLACTELPVALAGARERPLRIVDATDVLARACVRASLGRPSLAMAG